MTKHRSFATKDPEPFTFSVNGHRIDDREPWEETFTVVPVVHSQVLDDLIRIFGTTPAGEQIWAPAALAAFIRSVLADSDRDRWAELCADRNRIIQSEDFIPIVQWLSEALLPGPLDRLGISLSTPTISDPSSEDESSSPEETPTGSPPLTSSTSPTPTP
jgi:hypothetical protein